ncbi:MAG: carbonic anhydrase [Allosphingosinicella sp.]
MSESSVVALAPAPTAPGTGHTALDADQALALLKRGNRMFVEDAPPAGPISRRRRLEIAQSQAPFAVLVSCSDSRVGPEQLFGRGLGELFIVRNAGNTVASNQAMGSIEYAVAELGVPLIVVLGHERCGAVAAAASVVSDNTAFPGSIGRMVEPIVPAVLAVRGEPGDMVDNAIRRNVRAVVHQLRTSVEPMLLEPQRQGKLKVVGAYYDLDTGVVDFFDEAPAAPAA